MKKYILLLLPGLLSAIGSNAQCSVTPPASTFIMSPSTVGNNYSLVSNNTYPISRAFYICQGTTVTIQNRPGNDTFYVAPGGGLVGFEPNAFKVFVQGNGSYNASNSGTAVIYYETGSLISNYTGPLLPPCPSLTVSMSLIGPNACGATGIPDSRETAENIFIYPNPVSSLLHINIYRKNASSRIVLLDLLGNEVLTKNTLSATETMDVSGLAPGIYFVTVYEGKELLGTMKFIRQ